MTTKVQDSTSKLYYCRRRSNFKKIVGNWEIKINIRTRKILIVCIFEIPKVDILYNNILYNNIRNNNKNEKRPRTFPPPLPPTPGSLNTLLHANASSGIDINVKNV